MLIGQPIQQLIFLTPPAAFTTLITSAIAYRYWRQAPIQPRNTRMNLGVLVLLPVLFTPGLALLGSGQLMAGFALTFATLVGVVVGWTMFACWYPGRHVPVTFLLIYLWANSVFVLWLLFVVTLAWGLLI